MVAAVSPVGSDGGLDRLAVEEEEGRWIPVMCGRQTGSVDP